MGGERNCGVPLQPTSLGQGFDALALALLVDCQRGVRHNTGKPALKGVLRRFVVVPQTSPLNKRR